MLVLRCCHSVIHFTIFHWRRREYIILSCISAPVACYFHLSINWLRGKLIRCLMPIFLYREYDPETYGQFFVFSIRLALSMQIIGFTVRILSSLLWIQIYRLGVSCVNSTASREADFDVRNSFLNPPIQEITTENSIADDIIGGSIYDPAYYSSLFQSAQAKGYVHEVFMFSTFFQRKI